jgi:hypothetical protein
MNDDYDLDADVQQARRMADCPFKPGTDHWRIWTTQFLAVHKGEASAAEAQEERLKAQDRATVTGRAPKVVDPALAVFADDRALASRLAADDPLLDGTVTPTAYYTFNLGAVRMDRYDDEDDDYQGSSPVRVVDPRRVDVDDDYHDPPLGVVGANWTNPPVVGANWWAGPPDVDKAAVAIAAAGLAATVESAMEALTALFRSLRPAFDAIDDAIDALRPKPARKQQLCPRHGAPIGSCRPCWRRLT